MAFTISTQHLFRNLSIYVHYVDDISTVSKTFDNKGSSLV